MAASVSPSPMLPSTHHTIIPHRSWPSTALWHFVRIRTFLKGVPGLRNIIEPPWPIPLKGQQQWDPLMVQKNANMYLGNEKATVEVWKDEKTGWSIPCVFPPVRQNEGNVSQTERVVLYFHGSS